MHKHTHINNIQSITYRERGRRDSRSGGGHGREKAATTGEHGGAPADGNGPLEYSRRGSGCRRGQRLIRELEERKCAWAVVVSGREVYCHGYGEDGNAGVLRSGECGCTWVKVMMMLGARHD